MALGIELSTAQSVDYTRERDVAVEITVACPSVEELYFAVRSSSSTTTSPGG